MLVAQNRTTRIIQWLVKWKDHGIKHLLRETEKKHETTLSRKLVFEPGFELRFLSRSANNSVVYFGTLPYIIIETECCIRMAKCREKVIPSYLYSWKNNLKTCIIPQLFLRRLFSVCERRKSRKCVTSPSCAGLPLISIWMDILT